MAVSAFNVSTEKQTGRPSLRPCRLQSICEGHSAASKQINKYKMLGLCRTLTRTRARMSETCPGAINESVTGNECGDH